jgi:type I restriction enzyme M protein
VIRFIINQIKPNLKKSEKILDPACGTGGFLVESLEYMKKDEKSKSDYEKLRYHTLYGTDKKPMPYLLCMMNLLLHEIDKPNIVRTNPLSRPFREISERDQYDVIITNPPFGGEEETGLSSNLPVGMQTSDTALSFLLFIMLSLKEKGRCGIILPNGPLFAGGVSAKIKEKLLSEFNLHTIIRLPKSVFSPYTGIETNILFFDKTGPTKEIWYYAMKLKEGIKAYNKTKPMQYEDFSEVLAWIKNKKQDQNAWKVSINEIKDFNLDIKNPNDKEEVMNLSPHELIDIILKNEEKTLDLLHEIKMLIKKEIPK